MMANCRKLSFLFVLISALLASCTTVEGAGTRVYEEFAGKRKAIEGSEPYVEALTAYQTKTPLADPKVIGGYAIRYAEAPWQVALVEPNLNDNVAFCGGVLISRRWVLTAAHCVEAPMTRRKVQVFANDNDLSDRGTRAAVRNIFLHPEYTPKTNDRFGSRPPYNDLALLRLRSPIRGKARPIKLPQFDETNFQSIVDVNYISPENEDERLPLFISGWGRVSVKSSGTRKLRGATVPLVDLQKCNSLNAYGDPLNDDSVIQPTQICAGYKDGEVDTCRGDSGGPLALRTGTSSPVLAGITSWGKSCAEPLKYGVYTRVSSFVPWIEQCMRNSSLCGDP